MNVTDDLRVFYIEPVGGHRGMHYYDFELCPALQAIGINVTLLTCDETENLKVPPSLSVEYPFKDIYGETPKMIRGLNYLRGLIRIGLFMQRHDILLAHLHYFHFPPLDYLYLKWLRFMGKGVVLTVHDVIPFDSKPSALVWLHRLYHEANRIIVHAQTNRDTIVEKFDLNPEKVHVIPMGPYLRFADEHILPASAAKLSLGIEPETPIALFFGQVKTVKGLSHLIRAFYQLLDWQPTARLIIAGPEWNEPFATYSRLIEELNLTDQVLTRIEYIPDEEVGTYFSAADVVILPYTESYQSAVLYMAYSFARPVIASDVGGLIEVVQNGVTGLLVPPGDEKRLADALFILLQDSEKARSMGRQGRKLVEGKFGWSEIALQTAAIYSKVVY